MTVSTILVMGPPSSGKSAFIEVLVGPEKLKKNATPTDDLRSMAISPYFADKNDTIRLVKFPGFWHTYPNPTDADLLIDFSVYLEGMRRRQEPVSGIIYTHRIDDNGLTGPDVERNLRMLQAIAGNQQQSQALQNVVVVTTNWGRPAPAGVDRNAKQRDLPGLISPILNLNPDQYMQHDGSKWSALRIVNIVKRKTPQPLYIQTQLERNPDPAFTQAAEEMVGDINTYLDNKRAEDRNLRDQLMRAWGRGDANQATTLSKQIDELEVILKRLRDEGGKLGKSVDWDQASRDNAQLDEKIAEMRAVATTDWKAEYDKMKSEYNKKKNEYNGIKNEYDGIKTELKSCQARSNALKSERDTLQANYNGMKAKYDAAGVRIRLKGTVTAGNYGGMQWLGCSIGDEVIAEGIKIYTFTGPAYRARNPSTGEVGMVPLGSFDFI